MSATHFEKRRQAVLRVGDTMTLTGLDTVLEDLYLEGWSAEDPGFEKALLKELRLVGNRIPENKETEAVAGVSALFGDYCAEWDH